MATEENQQDNVKNIQNVNNVDKFKEILLLFKNMDFETLESKYPLEELFIILNGYKDIKEKELIRYNYLIDVLKAEYQTLTTYLDYLQRRIYSNKEEVIKEEE